MPKCQIIRNFTFQNCNSLSEISLPECFSIANSVFWGCNNLKKITLNYEGVCSIGTSNLDYKPSLSVYVPASLVDAYTVAPNWSNYSSVIFPIE